LAPERSSLITEIADVKSNIRPADLLPLLRHALIDQRTGLVRRVTIQRPSAHDPAVFIASAEHAHHENAGLAAGRVGAGAGLSPDAAEVCALCEAVERYCLGNPPGRGTVRCRIDDLDPLSQRVARLLLASEGRPIDWVHGRSLVTGRDVLVPLSCVYLRSQPATDPEVQVPATSTGAATGRDLATATLAGLYEVVERDAFMLTWLTRHAAPVLDARRDAELSRLLDTLRDGVLGHGVHLVSADIPIPVILAVITDETDGTRRTFVGAAARLCPRDAITKALLEAHHIRAGHRFHAARRTGWGEPLASNRVKSYRDHALYYAQADRSANLEFLAGRPRSVHDLPCASRSPGRDLDRCVEVIADAGIDPIVVDITTPDIRAAGLVVVKVVAPGLIDVNPDHARPPTHLPRLYEVPQQLGWRRSPIAQGDLNADVHPFP
jgi:ribosomal protein S12 methylthiotransferase accessory factor